ncbi:hypothetical protein scyTo_0014803 [Scyliorhinus torazame]|uniref:Guanylate-binding protein/Atlastin C-terminal domain-containing protein n=1 Tax=Scyliorhinus torazame TaxID=75743 RepID=A0A401NUY3_SCYTO|nr:hypothetical protein [Scyliorhinus torazame]
MCIFNVNAELTMCLSPSVLGSLALTYVDSIRSGKIPCLESTVHMLSEIENTSAVTMASKAYSEWMEEQVFLPTETVEELSAIHNQCQSQALQLFMKQCFKDEDLRYQQEFMNSVAKIYADMCEKNMKKSLDISTAIMMDLGAAMKEKEKNGSYAKPGGYAVYVKDMDELVEGYRAESGKGVQAEKILQDFLEYKQQFSEHIRIFDESMSAREKELAAEREKAEVAEQERKGREEEQRAAQQRQEDQRRVMEENMAQLREKLEQDRIKLHQEHDRVLEQRLKEQEKLQREGFQTRAREMEKQIDSLKKQHKETESPSYLDRILDTAILILPVGYKLIPVGAKLVKHFWQTSFE